MKTKCPNCQYNLNDIESIKVINFSLESTATEQLSDEFCILLDSWLSDSSSIPLNKRAYFKSFSKVDGIWRYKLNSIVVSASSKLNYLQHFHGRADSGHFGFLKTREAIIKHVYWPNMDADISKFIASCGECQRSKDRNYLLPGLLHPLKIPGDICSSVGMDFATLPKSIDGFDFLLVITDRLSKFLVAIPTKKTLSAEECASLVYTNWFLRGFGFPDEIVSDRDKLFVSKFWAKFAQLAGITLSMSTSRHQQSNGLSEINVKMIKMALRLQCKGNDRLWTSHLDSILFAYNNSIHSSTGFTPFYLHHGFSPRTIPSFTRGSGNLLNTQFAQHQRDLEAAHENIAMAQQRQANQYDLKHNSETFSIGEYVLLSRSGLNYLPTASKSPILLQPFLGPFMISNVDVEHDNYTLALPSTMRCHKTFHVRCLKKYISPYIDFPQRERSKIENPVIVENGAPDYEIQEILDTKLVKSTRMFLVSWVGYDHSSDSWEPLENLDGCLETVYEFLQDRELSAEDDQDLMELKSNLEAKFGLGRLSCKCLRLSAGLMVNKE